MCGEFVAGMLGAATAAPFDRASCLALRRLQHLNCLTFELPAVIANKNDGLGILLEAVQVSLLAWPRHTAPHTHASPLHSLFPPHSLTPTCPSTFVWAQAADPAILETLSDTKLAATVFAPTGAQSAATAWQLMGHAHRPCACLPPLPRAVPHASGPSHRAHANPTAFSKWGLPWNPRPLAPPPGHNPNRPHPPPSARPADYAFAHLLEVLGVTKEELLANTELLNKVGGQPAASWARKRPRKSKGRRRAALAQSAPSVRCPPALTPLPPPSSGAAVPRRAHPRLLGRPGDPPGGAVGHAVGGGGLCRCGGQSSAPHNGSVADPSPSPPRPRFLMNSLIFLIDSLFFLIFQVVNTLLEGDEGRLKITKKLNDHHEEEVRLYTTSGGGAKVRSLLRGLRAEGRLAPARPPS